MVGSKRNPQVARILGIAQRLITASDRADAQSALSMFLRNGVAWSMCEEEASIYRELVDAAARLAGSGYSRRFAESTVQEALTAGGATLPEPAQVAAAIVDVLTATPPMARVLCPIQGVDLQVPSVVIGDVTLRPRSAALGLFEQLVEDDTQRDAIREHFVSGLRGATAFADVEVAGDPEHATQLACARADTALDLVRFVAAVTVPSGYRPDAGLLGDFVVGGRSVLLQPAGGGLVVRSETLGPLSPIRLDESFLNVAASMGVDRLYRLVSSTPPPDNFHDRVMRSLFWFGRAQRSRGTEFEWLSLVTALELFFNERGERGITEAVADGTAFVLGSSVAERIVISKNVRRFYAERSKISHAGQRGGDEAEVSLLRQYVHRTIQWSLRNLETFSTSASLRSWLTEQRYR